ncbi:MAG: amidase [Gammaproteobacteria bacterium]
MNELDWMTLREMREAFAARTLSPLEVAHHALERIERLDPQLNAFVTVDAPEVMAQARRAEQALFDDGVLAPLHGIPISIKDSIPTRGLRTTWGSLLYADLVPSRDATLVARLRRAGAIILGKTNVPEFQVVGRTRNRLMRESFNPWDIRRSAGGSSGGSAASVAAGINPASIGGDDGGSIRLPAAYCGIFGLCPSAGRVPRIALPPEGGYPGFVFQNVGPMTRDVRDAATILQIIAGPDDEDPYAMAAPPADWLASIESGVGAMKLGWVTFPAARVEPDVERLARAAARTLEALGARMEDAGEAIQVPGEQLGAIVVAYLADWFEAIAADPARRQRLAPYTQEFLAAGRPGIGQERAAWRARSALIARCNALFERFDALLTPTTGRVAPQVQDAWDLPHPTQEYAAATIFVNATGLTAASVPCGFVDGMPAGLQIIARRGGEETVLRIARALEQAQPWAARRPGLAS